MPELIDRHLTQGSSVQDAGVVHEDVEAFVFATNRVGYPRPCPRIGDVQLEVVKEIGRCVIVTRAQPGLQRDKDVLVHVHRTRAGNLGVGATIRGPGTIAVGDQVLLV